MACGTATTVTSVLKINRTKLELERSRFCKISTLVNTKTGRVITETVRMQWPTHPIAHKGMEFLQQFTSMYPQVLWNHILCSWFQHFAATKFHIVVKIDFVGYK